VSNNVNDLPSLPGPVTPSGAQGADPPPHLVPPELPPELLLPEGAAEVLKRLESIWLQTAPDTIGGDLESARNIAGSLQCEDAEFAKRYVTSLTQLEHWLRDR
jgi:hypothetical protein